MAELGAFRGELMACWRQMGSVGAQEHIPGQPAAAQEWCRKSCLRCEKPSGFGGFNARQ